MAGSQLRLADKARPPALMLRGPLVLGVLALALAALAAFGEGFWTLGFGTAAAILLVVALLQQGGAAPWALAQTQRRTALGPAAGT